jgi:hypothetical protein
MSEDKTPTELNRVTAFCSSSCWCCSWVTAGRFTARVQGGAGHTTAEDCSVSS